MQTDFQPQNLNQSKTLVLILLAVAMAVMALIFRELGIINILIALIGD